MCQGSRGGSPNFYARAVFAGAGLRRGDTGWIVGRIADPVSLFVPVWHNQNLVIELDGGDPRAVVLPSTSIAEIIGQSLVAEERLATGEVVFLGVIEERAHFALDLSPVAAPLEMLHSPAL